MMHRTRFLPLIGGINWTYSWTIFSIGLPPGTFPFPFTPSLTPPLVTVSPPDFTIDHPI